MIRRHVLQIGSAVGLIIGWLWLATFAVPSSAAQGAGTPTPQPTVKTCHICDEDETAATPTKAAIPAALPAIVAPPGPERPIVHAVMFWMDGCSHCHDVIDHVLPPLQQKYGEQFDLQLIEVVTTEDIDRLYEVGAAFGLVKEQVGVPFLIIGDRVLVGSDQIPAELPQLIEQHLTGGGVAYPAVPGLASAAELAAGCSVATPCADSAAPSQAGAVSADTAAHIAPVSNGFALAIAIMIGMVGALAYSGFTVIRRPADTSASIDTRWRDIAFVLLTLIGLGVAGYLAYVETQAVAAVCGPVGDCNAVQTSEYAYLFGVLPIGVLGVIGYVLVLITWLWGRLRSDRVAGVAPLIVFGLTAFGVVFSLYLTFLEPFVIKAVCIWCLTSAVILTVLMLLSLRPARIGLARRQSQE